MSLNTKYLICLVLVLDVVLAFKSFPGFRPEAAHADPRAGSSQPLILTPYLNDPASAQKYAQVDSIGNFTSYSGKSIFYIAARKKYLNGIFNF